MTGQHQTSSSTFGTGITAGIPIFIGYFPAAVAFGNTDEVFAVASTREGYVGPRFMAGIEGVSYLGWVSGTVTGYLFGSVLPGPIQAAVGGTLYALFGAFFVPGEGEYQEVLCSTELYT